MSFGKKMDVKNINVKSNNYIRLLFYLNWSMSSRYKLNNQFLFVRYILYASVFSLSISKIVQEFQNILINFFVIRKYLCAKK
jgi:hypothetical protein